MINHDYYCSKCNTEATDIITGPPMCCGKSMSINFGVISLKFNPNNASMYGKYHPGFGCVVEDYAHKKRLLKQYNVIEAADSVGGSRQHERPPGYRGPGLGIDESQLPKREKTLGGWIDSDDDIKRMEKEALDDIRKN